MRTKTQTPTPAEAKQTTWKFYGKCLWLLQQQTIDRILGLEIIWYQTLENRVQSTTGAVEQFTAVDAENLRREESNKTIR